MKKDWQTLRGRPSKEKEFPSFPWSIISCSAIGAISDSSLVVSGGRRWGYDCFSFIYFSWIIFTAFSIQRVGDQSALKFVIDSDCSTLWYWGFLYVTKSGRCLVALKVSKNYRTDFYLGLFGYLINLFSSLVTNGLELLVSMLQTWIIDPFYFVQEFEDVNSNIVSADKLCTLSCWKDISVLKQWLEDSTTSHCWVFQSLLQNVQLQSSYINHARTFYQGMIKFNTSAYHQESFHQNNTYQNQAVLRKRLMLYAQRDAGKLFYVFCPNPHKQSSSTDKTRHHGTPFPFHSSIYPSRRKRLLKFTSD